MDNSPNPLITPEMRDYIDRTVANWPPLSTRQITRVISLLNLRRPTPRRTPGQR